MDNKMALMFRVGMKSPVEFPSGASSFLLESNKINIALKMDNIQKIEIDNFNKGVVDLQLIKYGKDLFNLEEEVYAMGFNIGGLRDGLVLCNFTIKPKDCTMINVEDASKGYGFNFFLVDENNIIVSMRVIGVSQDFSNEIKKVFDVQNLIGSNPKKYARSVRNIYSAIDHLTNAQVIDKFKIANYSK